MGYKPGQCLVVEDARSGIDAAIAGGFSCAGLGDAAAYEKTDYPIHKFSDIFSLVADGNWQESGF